MTRPTDFSTSEDIEIKGDILEIKRNCSDDLQSSEYCDKITLVFRMNSFNNERTITSNDTGDLKEMSVDEKVVAGTDNVEITSTKLRRRMALADIFENVNDNEMVTLLSLYVKHEIAQAVNQKWLGRRGGKSNIFEGVDCDEIKDMLKRGDTDIMEPQMDSTGSEVIDTCSDISDDMIHHLKQRRGGKCDIFEGLTDDQKQDIFEKFCEHFNILNESSSGSDDDSHSEDESRRTPRRRGGKFDIFEGLTNEERIHILQSYLKRECENLDELQVGYGR